MTFPRLSVLLAFPVLTYSQQLTSSFSFGESQRFLKTYCAGCHTGKSAAGGFPMSRVASAASIGEAPEHWHSVVNRIRNGEMPPKGAPAPSLDQREAFVNWAQDSLRAQACAAGPTAGPAPIRRLNRSQYAATMRDLLNLHLDAAAGLPADGAGGEGFDNAAETLFVTPIHAEKYLDAAKQALTAAAKDPRARAKFMIANPGDGITPDEAARKILLEFLPRAFRRPVAGE
jgi:hypothetical protein